MIEIQPIHDPPNVEIEVPGSKSFTNRALLVAALAQGDSTLTGALFSDDTYYMCDALRKLGVHITEDSEEATFHVTGNGGNIPVKDSKIVCWKLRHNDSIHNQLYFIGTW